MRHHWQVVKQRLNELNAARGRGSATESASLKSELRRLTATVQASITAWCVIIFAIRFVCLIFCVPL